MYFNSKWKMTGLLALVFVAASTSTCHVAHESVEEQQPNVLFIAIDDLNDWLGCMQGHPNAKTPNIDRLAARGTLFTNAHCQAPICGPSRASLMTGLRPTTTGIYGQINDVDLRTALSSQDYTFLPKYFGDEGYKTMGVGKLFHHFAPEGVFDLEGGRVKGFGPRPAQRIAYDPERLGKPKGTVTDWGIFPQHDSLMPDVKSVRWAQERLREDHDEPIFLAVGFLRPHVPWLVPPRWFDLHPLDSIKVPPYLREDLDDVPPISREVHEVPMMPTTEWAAANGEWPKIIQAYLACISFVDHYVGELLSTLESGQYSDNTVVVLWSDHGYHLGEKNRFAKHSLWEESTHVPLIIAGPNLPQGSICDDPVELLDMYPTLADLCGLPAPAHVEGKSLRPLLSDQPVNDWPPAITSYGRGNISIRTKNARLITYADGSKEYYDHSINHDEWQNIEASSESLVQLSRYNIADQASWAKHSNLNVNEYFRKTSKE